ncbi:5-oxoprolinase subunit C family protein [Sporosarcina obsidiansis]|uniref:5-oxoprolinase subunit C family protein n=1 Tax=Sporosarcina obsidiansis TaxID=2660748 RepID=UPI00129BBF9A|nr:biotin-dependent carboxyltransferase family protein [Sporosarcina obsidiansis]
MTINVLNPGLLATLQDIGRHGSQKYGVIVSGAMDSYSLRIANILVGNPQDEGAVEISLFGTTLQFNEDTVVAITGGDLQATIDGFIAPTWRPIIIKKGSVLKFGFALEGCRAYVSIAGGFDTPRIMGSKSTYITAGIGGIEGRPLQQGDTLTCGELTEMNKKLYEKLARSESTSDWLVPYHSLISLKSLQTIRMIEGTEFERFDDSSIEAFLNTPYIVTPHSNRMGSRLEGPSILLKEKFELLSEGVTFGTVQIPPSGKPIILMADRQTTGGYPKIGQVITADLGSLSQLKPGGKLRFEVVSHSEAERLLLLKEEIIREIEIGVTYKIVR